MGSSSAPLVSGAVSTVTGRMARWPSTGRWSQATWGSKAGSATSWLGDCASSSSAASLSPPICDMGTMQSCLCTRLLCDSSNLVLAAPGRGEFVLILVVCLVLDTQARTCPCQLPRDSFPAETGGPVGALALCTWPCGLSFSGHFLLCVCGLGMHYIRLRYSLWEKCVGSSLFWYLSHLLEPMNDEAEVPL